MVHPNIISFKFLVTHRFFLRSRSPFVTTYWGTLGFICECRRAWNEHKLEKTLCLYKL